MITREDLMLLLDRLDREHGGLLTTEEEALDRVRAEVESALPPEIATVTWTRNSDPK